MMNVVQVWVKEVIRRLTDLLVGLEFEKFKTLMNKQEYQRYLNDKLFEVEVVEGTLKHVKSFIRKEIRETEKAGKE